ncbi:MAG: DUF2076 domain-containing protein [Hyphomicrobiales bacterium]|nr:DUF2076 domain-containing protein [Hyphomicrobiales bacterium]
MTPEERQLLEGLFERIKTAAPNAPDKEAEELIGKSMKDMPHAGYVLSQAVIVQEEALKAAVAKIEDLEGQVRDLEEKAQKAEAGSGGFLGGIGKSLFGGSEPAPRQRDDRRGYDDRSGYDERRSAVPSSRGPGSGISVPPRPGQDGASPWMNQGGPGGPGGPGMSGRQQAEPGGGNSFLKGALGAAAGVAGGMLLANAVGGLFSGKSNPLGIGGANASESKSSDSSSSSGDDWGDSKSSSSEGDDWKEEKSDNNSGDDWGNDNDTGDDWDDEGDDWDDDGGDDGDWE